MATTNNQSGGFISFILICILIFLIVKLWRELLVIGIVIGIVLLIIFILQRRRRLNSTINIEINAKTNTNKVEYLPALKDLDGMNGLFFEKYVAELLSYNGFSNIRVTKASGDFGVDVLAERDTKTFVFQCKNYKSNLGVKPIQEVFSGAAKYNADIPVVITNSYFTNHAIELANSLNVLLWDRDYLEQMIKTGNLIKLKTYQQTKRGGNDS